MDQKIWYVVVKGKPEGPFTQSEMQSRIESGSTKTTDYVFRPGLANWTPVSDCKEFESVTTSASFRFNLKEPAGTAVSKSGGDIPVSATLTATPKPSSEATVPETDFNFGTAHDPHRSTTVATPRPSAEEVTLGMEDAEEAPQDITKNFDPGQEKPEPSISVVRFEPSQTKTSIEKIGKVDAAASPTPPVKVIESKAETAASKPASESSSAKGGLNKKWRVALAATAACMMMAVVGSFMHYRGTIQHEKTMAQTAPPAVVVPAAREVASVTTPSAEAPIQAAHAQPRGLHAVPLRLASSQPQLTIEGSFSAGEAVELEIRARGGQILKYPSFLAKRTIRAAQGQVPVFNLADLHLPAGNYTAQVRSGDLKTEVKLAIGNQDADFKGKLTAFQKVVAQQQHKEKASLQKWTNGLERSVANLKDGYKKSKKGKNAKKQWADFMKAWKKKYGQMTREMPQFSEVDRNKFAYPESFMKLRTAGRQLGVVSKALDNQLRAGRSVASAPQAEQELSQALKSLKADLKRMK